MYYQVKIAVYIAKTLTVCFKNTVRPISREKVSNNQRHIDRI